VKALTGGKGVAAAIEVTGVGAGLDETLDCMAKLGRVALLGCTRSSDFTIDYYRKVHCPGITLIGAHTNARPKVDSYGGWWTDRDDIQAVLKLLQMGRLDFSSLSYDGNVFSPMDCPAVYDRVLNDRSFPTLAQFDWRKVWEN
jgi:threonine dehydrogenase-like Zn-dependent dehydrogenase